MTTDDDGDGIVTEQRFLCPMRIEAKPTITSSREGFITGPYKETGGSCPKSLELLKVFLKTR